MGKKTIILTQSQLNEICGGNCSYFDNEPQYTPNEIYSSDVNLNNNNITGDDVAMDQPNTNRRATRVVNGRTSGLMEVNSNIQTMRFGAENGDTGHTAEATRKTKERYQNAINTAMTAATPEQKTKARNTIKKMQKNSPNIQQQINQYNAAIQNDKNIRKSKVANGERVIKQHSKESGNGQGHLKQGEAITYFE